MNRITLDDETRRYIGDLLLGANGSTMPISGLSINTGISRPTLTKWIADDYRLWDFTRHIDDRAVWRRLMYTPYARDSKFFYHTHAYCHRVIEIRSKAASGELGAEFKALEEGRIRAQNAKR